MAQTALEQIAKLIVEGEITDFAHVKTQYPMKVVIYAKHFGEFEAFNGSAEVLYGHCLDQLTKTVKAQIESGQKILAILAAGNEEE